VYSVLAGTDLEMPGPARERGAKLVQAVTDGRLLPRAVRACAERVLRLMERVGSFADPTIPTERADDLPAHRALIRKLGAEGCVLLKNDGNTLPLAPLPGQKVAVIGIAATVPQIMGGGSATVNAHYRVAPLDALRAQWPQAVFTHHRGADIHRWVPVVQEPVHFDFFDSTDLSGAVVSSQQLPNTEQMWIGQLSEGVAGTHFSARATLRYVADKAGVHQFSLISAGLSRAFIHGELVVDAWTSWSRGETYFTFGCEEVLHERTLGAGEVCHITVEYSTAAPEEVPFRALRFGAHRKLDAGDIAEAVQAARNADVAIVFAGLNAEWDNEGLDRHSLELPHAQNTLVAQVAAANARTVVVLQTGSPVVLPWLGQVSAVLQAWYPGQECGNAIADVLLGAAEPGGRLPQSWPLRLADMVGHGSQALYPGHNGHVRYGEGVFIGYRHYQRAGLAVQFPFGHGLSYSQFSYGPLRGAPETLHSGGSFSVEMDVQNTGARAASTVLQLYVSDSSASVERPLQELKAFAKLHLAAGAQGTARFTLGMRAFAFYDEAAKRWRAEAGAFVLHVGSSAEHILASAPLTLLGDWTSP
jgi:beta-glucosidase